MPTICIKILLLNSIVRDRLNKGKRVSDQISYSICLGFSPDAAGVVVAALISFKINLKLFTVSREDEVTNPHSCTYICIVLTSTACVVVNI